METKEYSIEVGGKTVTAVFSNLADQANGSVILKCAGTMVLATAVISKDGRGNMGYFNLTVEYLEKYYAAGVILGGQFNKREGRPSDKAILNSRVIDRTLRPLFDQRMKNAVQVITTVLSLGDMDPGILAVNAASLAIATSDIPWRGPVGAVHISMPKGGDRAGALLVNSYTPSIGEPAYDLDLTVCGKEKNLVMIEAMTFEYGEDTLSKALALASEEITKLEEWQKKIVSEIGKVKLTIDMPVLPAEIPALFTTNIEPALKAALSSGDTKKVIGESQDMWTKMIEEAYPPITDYTTNKANQTARDLAHEYFDTALDRLVHELALLENKRVDGRAFDQVRALYAKAGGFSDVLHGSGIFYRGETHVLSTLTLAGPEAQHALDGMEIRGKKRFMHHYNFPPYSAGETGRMTGTNRREMGHGMLAEKALSAVIPSKEQFPYTIRVVSESLASNGSTSQASICASSLALMDGGVPIKAPVAGIAMGLILGNGAYKILTDIQGPEDHYGDMDFKIAGTTNGVTAIQLDIKVDGVPVPILVEALADAKKARLHILETIQKEIATPRANIAPHAPKIMTLKILPTQIGMVIGPGGKNIHKITDDTGAEISIEDDGTVYVTGKNGAAEKAYQMIADMTREWKVGEKVEGEVVKIIEVGAIVKIAAGKDGLVHISEIANFRVNKVTDVLSEGMKVPVVITAVDTERDRISLSIKAADPNFIKMPQPPKA